MPSAASVPAAPVRSSSRASAPHWEDEVKWPDGSHAVRKKNESGWFAADLEVAGVDCLYYVWSTLNPQHLELLLKSLRRVEKI